jgi:quercetin dioxygenase-like cupin family protein
MVIWRPGLRRGPRTVLRFRTSVTNSIVAAGTGHYRVEDRVTAVGPGDLLFAAAHVAHGFEDFSEDFAIWIVFYGPVK